jgi:RNA 2',3'-cyclic 3'-phosphodiesterase
MHRLFVALRPPPAIRAALLAATGDGAAGVRWQDDEQLHLTLRFIGEVERTQAEDVAAALAGVMAPVPTVRVEGVGAFDQRGRVDTLWARVVPAEPLAALHRKVDQALVRCGLPPEHRAYLPHITLARMNAAAGAADAFLQHHAALASPPFRLDHFLLYESHLGHEAARYEAVGRYPLTG